ncbi:MAG: hypothetical protein WC614_12420 [bacterium]
MKAEEYIELFESIQQKLPEAKDKETIALAIMQELAKDRRMEEIKANGGNGDKPATPKQIAYMKKLGITPDEGMTKQEASKLIDEAVAGR